MHGIGNDYIYLDCIANPMPDNIEQFSRHASDRHTGIGGDGVVLILPSGTTPISVNSEDIRNNITVKIKATTLLIIDLLKSIIFI